MQKFTRSLLAVGAVLGLAACGDDVSVTETPPPTPTVTGITVSGAPTIKVGETVVFSANVQTSGSGVNTAVAWSSGNSAIATVNATTGAVTGVAAGSTTIKATSAADAGISGSAAVTVVQPGVQSVSLAPGQLNLVVGNTGQVTATVARDAGVAGTVNWATGNAAVATVTGTGSTVTITAVAVGTTTITATSTADASKSAAIGVTVAPAPLPPTVSIASITQGANVPVNLAGVGGQVEATLNIFSGTGNVQLSHAIVLIGNKEMARQTFTNGAPSAAITLSVNTANFDANYVPDIINGPNTFKAQIFAVGNPATPAAENTIQVTITNQDVVYFNASTGTTGGALGLNHTGTSATQVSGPANTWWKGGFTFRAHPVLYSGAANVTGITYNSSACGAAAGVAANFAATFSCSGVESAQNITNALTISYVAGYTYTTSPAAFMTAATPGYVPGKPVYSVVTTREDNVGPTTAFAAGMVAFNDNFDQQWVNASYAFLGDFTFTDAGVGVNAASRTVKLWVSGAPGACSGATVVTGADLGETIASDGSPDGYRVCANANDALGNVGGSTGASNWFGVDKGAPAVRVAGSTAATPTIAPATVAATSVGTLANTKIYSMASPFAATDVWGIEAQDTRAGFNQNVVAGFPAKQSMVNHANGAYACGFTGAMPTALSDNYVRTSVLPTLDCGFAAAGYFWYEGYVVDRAGNESSRITRNFAIDQYAAPAVTAVLPATTFMTVGQSATFNVYGTDDLEVIEADLVLDYPGMAGGLTSIAYPQTTSGVRWDNSLNTPVVGQVLSVATMLGRVDFTCSGAGAPYASCAIADGKAATGSQYNNVGGGTDAEKRVTGASATFYDVASQASAAFPSQAINPLQLSGTVAQPWTAADLVTWKLTSTGVTITAEHKASTSITNPYFDSVLLGRVYGTNVVLCGVSFNAPVMTDNGLNRFFTYSVTKPTSGPCALAGGGLWHAIGLKGGAALATQGL